MLPFSGRLPFCPLNCIGMLLVGVVEGVTFLAFFIRCGEGGTCMISTLTILYALIEIKWSYPSVQPFAVFMLKSLLVN